MQRRAFLATLAATLLAHSPLAYSNDWPTRSIKIVVPFPPGGSTDILGRATAEYLQKSLGVPVVVENMPGATGTIGTAAVARAAPDGYTLMMGSIGTMITNHFVFDQLSYGIKSLDPIINIAETPNVVLVNPKLNINTLAKEAATQLDPNAIGHVELLLQEAIPTAPFTQARVLGSLILVDTASHKTAGAVLVN